MTGSEGVIKGSGGKVVSGGTLLARVTQWTLDNSSSETAWGDSDSEGFTNRASARKDGTGSLQGKFDRNQKFYNILKPGDIIGLDLWEDADQQSPSQPWIFPRALIQSFNLVFNQDDKEVVGWTANYGADGKFYAPGEAGAPSRSLPSAS